MDGFVDASEILRSGVYLLCFRGRVQYVGKAKRLYSRVYAHRHMMVHKSQRFRGGKRIVFDQVLIKTCHVDEMDQLEKILIELHDPPYNICLRPRRVIKDPVRLSIRGVDVVLNAPIVPPVRQVWPPRRI